MQRRTALYITGATLTTALVAGGFIWANHDPASPSQADTPSEATVEATDGAELPADGDAQVGEDIITTWYEEPATEEEPDHSETVTVDAGELLDADPGPLGEGQAAYPLDEDQWLVLDTSQPLPDEITSDLEETAADLPVPSAEFGSPEYLDAVAAHEQFAQDVAAHTGRWPILIYPQGEQWEAWFMVDHNSYTAAAPDRETAQAQARVLADQHTNLGLFHPEFILEHPATATY